MTIVAQELRPIIPTPILVREVGLDGKVYIIRPFEWDLESAERYFSRFEAFHIFSDDIPKTVDGFIRYIVTAGSIWFEVVDEATDEGVGFLYITDPLKSSTENRFINATFHSVVWDANAHARMPVAKAFIKEIFRVLKLHRLTAQIPLKNGGAIRATKRLGFVEEGILESARRYNGQWFGVLVLSILEDEVNGSHIRLVRDGLKSLKEVLNG